MNDTLKKRTSFACADANDASGIPFISNARKHRKVSPLGMRVLVRLHKEDNLSEGGLYLPEGAKQNMDQSVLAEVIEVASAADTDSDDETNISGIPLGATILMPKQAGTTVPWDPELRIVDTKEVLAIVDQVTLD